MTNLINPENKKEFTMIQEDSKRKPSNCISRHDDECFDETTKVDQD